MCQAQKGKMCVCVLVIWSQVEQGVQLVCVSPEGDISGCLTDAYVDGRQPGMAPMTLHHSPNQTHALSHCLCCVCLDTASDI